MALLFAFFLIGRQGIAGSLHKEEVSSTTSPMVVSALASSFDYYATALDRWLYEASNPVISSVVRGDVRPYEHVVLRGTIAQFEFTATRNGVIDTRVYNAMSGWDFDSHVAPNLVPPQSGVEAFFRGDPVITRAVLVPDATIQVQPVEGEPKPDSHQADAELKAVQTIERDIRADRERGVELSGGTIRAVVSQPMCTSCEAAVQALADRYDVDIFVIYLHHTNTAEIDVLRQARKEYMKSLWNELRLRRIAAGTSTEDQNPPPTGEVGDDEVFATCPVPANLRQRAMWATTASAAAAGP
ncbi:hypothetical protein [Luteibacter rhizovicinus]|uniref:hypothetical protein n=1 Tax=Luteibacter rhizovicinus TaxID=242606 RepID=UPI001048FEA3|nr:hypothetical protein [Luteibacter rhizovicinus]